MVTADELRRFQRREVMVRFESRFEPFAVCGYVVAVGTDLVALVHVDHCVLFDGFRVHRIADVRRLRAEPNAAFRAAALERRRDRRPAWPNLRLRGFADLVRSAGRQFPLVTIHRERADPDVCHIGAVVDVTERHVTLRAIRPDATWRDEVDSYAIREITRVDFGGLYEDALHVVGGRPPALPRRNGAPARRDAATTARPRRRTVRGDR